MATLAEKLDVKRKKDFIKENIFHAKHLHPAELKQRSVDTRRGDTYDLKKSGLLPIYVHKKVRIYIIQRIILILLLYIGF